MIIDTEYIRPNITIETEQIGPRNFFVHNYKGVCYRVFDSFEKTNKFLDGESVQAVFECNTEEELECFFNTFLRHMSVQVN